MCSKKTLLIVSGAITVVLFVLNWVGTFKLCGGQEYGQCMDFSYGAIINLLPVVPLFLFSLITYKMRDDVYRAWLRLAQWWIPLSMLAIFLAPEYSSDWMFSIVKGTVAFFSSLLFVAISIVLILWKYFAARRAS
jgi:hypothetical protein